MLKIFDYLDRSQIMVFDVGMDKITSPRLPNEWKANNVLTGVFLIDTQANLAY